MSLYPLKFGEAVMIAERIAVDGIQAFVRYQCRQSIQEFFAANIEIQQGWTQNLAVLGNSNYRFAQRRNR